MFGEYREPTGGSHAVSIKTEGLDEIRDGVDAVSDKLAQRLKFMMCKLRLDGHSNGAKKLFFARTIAVWISLMRAFV